MKEEEEEADEEVEEVEEMEALEALEVRLGWWGIVCWGCGLVVLKIGKGRGGGGVWLFWA